jgi:hypothetical protein
MSDVYEVGFLLDLRDDLPDAVHELLVWMVAKEEYKKKLDVDILEHCSFQSEYYLPYSPEELLEELGSLIEDDEDIEQLLGEGTGSDLTLDGRLIFRGIVHEDSFHNIWMDFLNWLSSISFSSGVVGYYRIYGEQEIRLITFEIDCIHWISCEDYSEFEALHNEIIEELVN